MARQLRSDVWWFDLLGVNAYLVVDEGDPVLVDAGLGVDAGAVRSGLADAGFTVSDLARVLVTHYDPDHVGGLRRLEPDCPVYVGAGDAPYLRGQLTPPWTAWKGLLQRVLRPFVQPTGLDVRPVTDGDRLGSFTVYDTPGHTPGHVAYVSETLDVAFLGDLVQSTDGGLRPPPWLLSENMRAVRESIQHLVDTAPEVAVAAPGHGDPILDGGTAALRAAIE
jgi:glyoxylase-like metal-dependent hydrolase (beta-lactamase superfamily II)